MKTTKQIEREAKYLLRLCLVGGNLDESRVRLVAQTILESKRRGYLSLLGRFKRLLEHEYARRRAVIESAVALPTVLRTRVQTGLTAVYGPGLTWFFTGNPTLIGGIRITVGSDVYDGSVRSGLAALARSFEITNTNGRHAEP
ncbi:MAG: F0F1 ATP synthase subunit delta [Candidatus Sulfotelmatobacter sp.]